MVCLYLEVVREWGIGHFHLLFTSSARNENLIKSYEKEMCHCLLLSQFSIFSFSTLTFLLYPDIMPSMCNNVWLLNFTSIIVNIIVSIGIESRSSLRIMLLVKPYPANTYFPLSWSGNRFESFSALNLWQISSLYIS